VTLQMPWRRSLTSFAYLPVYDLISYTINTYVVNKKQAEGIFIQPNHIELNSLIQK